MNNLMSDLNTKQIRFIADECGIEMNAVKEADDKKAYKLYECMCDIEVEETIKAGDNDLSERGKLAEKIVTIVGNKIRNIKGYPI